MKKSLGFPGCLVPAIFLSLLAGCSENTPTNTDDTESAGNGRVYATRRVGLTSELLSMNADGSDLRVLRQEVGIICSPRKGKVVIATDSNALVLTDLDGKVIRIIPTVAKPAMIVLSPDASKICYGYRDYPSNPRQVYTLRVVNADGTGDVVVAEDGGWENTVAFSPDSKRIVYYGDEAGNAPDKLFTVNTDGTDRQLVTENALSLNDRFGSVAWSSKGDRILFLRAWESHNDLIKVWTIRPDGTDARELTDLAVPFALFPSFSSDGTMVVFCGVDSGGVIEEKRVDLWVMKSDGTDKRHLTVTPGPEDVETFPQWSPDGKSILYVSFEIPDVGDPETGRLKLVDVVTGNSRVLIETLDIYSAYWGWN